MLRRHVNCVLVVCSFGMLFRFVTGFSPLVLVVSSLAMAAMAVRLSA